MRILCVWFPNWPVQRLRVARPELAFAAGPWQAVLHECDARGRSVVAACSAAATEAGVDVGMPLAEAASILRSPSAKHAAMPPRSGTHHRGGTRGEAAHGQRPSSCVWQPLDRWADRAALDALARQCAAWSPRVAVLEPAPASLPGASMPWSEGLLLDVTGLEPLFGSEAELACRVSAHLVQQGYRVRSATADTVGAAWAVARYGQYALAEGAASGLAPGGGWQCVPPEATAESLAALPVAALRVTWETIERLARLGVETVGEAARLPRAGVRSRLGPEVLLRLDQALGRVAEPLEGQRPTATLSAAWTSDEPVESLEALGQVLEHVACQVGRELASLGQGAVRVTCHLQSAEGTRHVLSTGFYRPTGDVRRWCELIHLQWELLDLSTGVVGLELLVVQTAPLGQRQQQLFAIDAPGAAAPRADALSVTEQAWGRLVEQLAGRLGPQAVLRARLASDAQPEWAVRWESWLTPPAAQGGSGGRVRRRPAARRAAASPPDDLLLAAPRDDLLGAERDSLPEETPRVVSPPSRLCVALGHMPLRLYERPIPLSGVALAGDGAPRRLELEGQGGPVAWAEGPQRIETGWWRGAGVRRDYWRVALVGGARWWIYRDLRTRRWFLHGEYG